MQAYFGTRIRARIGLRYRVRIVACIESVVLSFVLALVSDAYVRAWAVQAQAKGAGAGSQGRMLSRVRIVARITTVLRPYQRPIRALCTIRAQYSNLACDRPQQ